MNFQNSTTESDSVELSTRINLNDSVDQLLGDPDLRYSITEGDSADHGVLHGISTVDSDTEDIVFGDCCVVFEFRRCQQRGRSGIQIISLSSGEQQRLDTHRNIKLACIADWIECHAGNLMQMTGF